MENCLVFTFLLDVESSFMKITTTYYYYYNYRAESVNCWVASV